MSRLIYNTVPVFSIHKIKSETKIPLEHWSLLLVVMSGLMAQCSSQQMLTQAEWMSEKPSALNYSVNGPVKMGI